MVSVISIVIFATVDMEGTDINGPVSLHEEPSEHWRDGHIRS